jgi:hypothetical protein
MPPDPPIHAWYVGHTRGLQPFLSPSNILSHRKVPFPKMPPPPTGKSLKKALSQTSDPAQYYPMVLSCAHAMTLASKMASILLRLFWIEIYGLNYQGPIIC